MSIIAFAKQMKYTFHTTCGTTREVTSNVSFSDATLQAMMNDINQQDCGTTPETIEIN